MLALVAEYPLGTYAGGDPSGGPETLPGPDRLFAALLAAAGSGAHAQEIDGRLVPRPQDLRLLEWVESHPPDGICRPEVAPGRALDATAYRQQGLARGKNDLVPPKASPAVRRSALAGPLIWFWNDFPTDLRDTMEELVCEVAYLGPAESQVILTTREDLPADSKVLARHIDADPYQRYSGLQVAVPRPGRSRALITRHAKALEHPSTRSDRVGSNESSTIDQWPAEHLEVERYARSEPEPPGLPWPAALALQVRASRGILPHREDALRVCVAAHRALVSILASGGRDVDAWITGRFHAGVPRPANRIAIHYLPRTEQAALTWNPLATAVLLMMLPAGLPAVHRDDISKAIRTLCRRGLNISRREGLELLAVTEVSGATFWRTVPTGSRRLWQPRPVAVVERYQRGSDLADAVRLSLRMVLRDHPERHHEIAQVEVLAARKRRGPGLDRFVHRMNAESRLVPYDAVIDLDGLFSDTGLVAIGQSRHLGGGLLNPIDVEPREV